jgi:hypothetical protein
MRKPPRGLSAVTYCSDFSRETIKSDVRVETEQGVTASGPREIFFSQCFFSHLTSFVYFKFSQSTAEMD